MSTINRKEDFLKKLKPFIPDGALEKGWQKGEQWKSIAIAFVIENKYSFPVESRRELLRYLYKTRSGWERKYKRQFGFYPSNESMWGGL